MKIRFAASAAAVFLLSAHAFAQTQTARLVGTVHDASGAALPNALVSATQQETRKRSETKTNSSGEYVLGALPPGSYTIEFEAPGFRKGVVRDLQLDVAANLSQSITLELGDVT